jgi:hypothetical protein
MKDFQMALDISCKCITYGRVDLLEESLYSFLNQKYQGRKEMVIVNDCPFQKLYFDHPEVRIFNTDPFNSIGEKENFAVENCKYNTIAVWDDDDIALPNHLENINQFFPGYDLLHWDRGALVNSKKIDSICGLGNCGIVYTKDIWERSGKHFHTNAGYDMHFVVKIKNDFNCKVIDANPEKISWFYMWGGRCYHMSGQGDDADNEENILIRHSRHIENLRQNGEIPSGDIFLDPKWNTDYIKMLEDYEKNNMNISS